MKNSSIMKKLEYSNEPEFDEPEKYRQYLRKASGFSCSYCTITESESCGATFNIDHFRPKKLFPQYYATCSNLRYSCPRCNSYKRARWIEEESGCIRDCDKCKNKLCRKNFERFVDSLLENPLLFLELREDDKLYPIMNSKPADYTIKSLRLNRMQLIKLRKIRRHIYLWRKELVNQRDFITRHKNSIAEMKKRYESCKDKLMKDEKNIYIMRIVETLFELLEIDIQIEEYSIEEHLRKLDVLLINEYQSDDLII